MQGMQNDEVKAICYSMYNEYSLLADCVWKFNEQIDELKRIELEKLDTYYPNDDNGKALRWYFESQKLEYFFPVTLNYAFLIMVFVTIETHLMKTCDLLYETRKLPLRAKELAGRGLDRYMNYLSKLASVSRDCISIWPQISNLTKLRNCVVHTAGYIDNSKDEKTIRAMVKDMSYLSKEDKERLALSTNTQEQDDLHFQSVLIQQIEGRDRLTIGRDYSFAITTYGRDFLNQIFEETSLPAVRFKTASTNE